MNWTCESCGVSVIEKADTCWNCSITRWRSQLLHEAKAQVRDTHEPHKVDLKATFIGIATVFSWVFSYAAYGVTIYLVVLCMDAFSYSTWGFGSAYKGDLIFGVMLIFIAFAFLSRPFSRSAAVRFVVAGVAPMILYICLHEWWAWYSRLPASYDV